MADYKPLRLGADNATITQFQTGDTVGVANGGTGATTPAAARTNLGLAIGADIQGYDPDLAAIAALTGTGIAVRTAADTWAMRNIATASASRITVANGDGVAGNPTLDLATVANSGTGALQKVTIDGYGRTTGYTAVVAADITALVDSVYVNVAGDIMTGPLTLNADPASAMHAATKQYVDAVAASGTPPWPSVRAGTTANITLSGLQTVDGVVLAAGDRVLVKNQTTASQNGIYIVAAGAWTRATDADVSTEFAPGRQVFVNEGTTNGDTLWALINNTFPVLGTDSINFTQMGGLGSIIAGAGLTKTGNTIDVGTASATRIVVNADNIDLAASGVTAGTYTKLTVDTYGRVTVGATATPSDIGAQPADATLTALAAYNTNGLLTQTAADTFVGRTLMGTAGRIVVANGNGVAGNPAVDLDISGVVAGTYNSVTVDVYGRVIAGTTSSTSYLSTALVNGEAAAINIGRVVYTSAPGSVKLANANAAGTKDVIGVVAATSIASGVSGSVATHGVVTATTGQWDAVTGQTGGLTSGARYYLSNTTAGALTTTAPVSGYVVQVGIALSATQLSLMIGPVIQL